MTGSDEVVLAGYLELEEEELLEELGADLLGDGPGFGPADAERYLRFARDWLEHRRADLQDRLCGDLRPRLEASGGFDKLGEAAAVADALQGLLGKPTAFIVAVVLARRGLDWVCGPVAG